MKAAYKTFLSSLILIKCHDMIAAHQPTLIQRNLDHNSPSRSSSEK
ncbi:hypothetical protein [Methanobacterium petrolearium]|nr:hypothetical protein [Methanobacterium petrolearium]MBP1944779.1 hypothetical protein [Methanobacterium petrolearium]